LRDHARLGKELEKIKSTIDTVYGRCAGNIIPAVSIQKEDILYNVSGNSLGEILTEVLKNHINIMNVYRSTVIGDLHNKEDLYLV
jgi:hypothetical protein